MKKRLLTFVTVLTCGALCALLPLSAEVSERRQKLIDYGLTLRGTPYKYAGKTPETGFDCSGFVSYVANHALDIRLSPSASQMYAQVTPIAEKDREPGDLIFFAVKTESGALRISHVGIYLGKYTGNGPLSGSRLMVHAASDGPRTGVIVSDIEERYWKNHFYGYGRILPASGDPDSAR